MHCFQCYAFIALTTSPLCAMIMLGFVLVFGILLDTFIVMPSLVPAIIVLFDKCRMHYFENGPIGKLTWVEEPDKRWRFNVLDLFASLDKPKKIHYNYKRLYVE